MNVYELGTKLGERQERKAGYGGLLGCRDGVRIYSLTILEGKLKTRYATRAISRTPVEIYASGQCLPLKIGGEDDLTKW